MANNPNSSIFSPVEQLKPKKKGRDMSHPSLLPPGPPVKALQPFGIALSAPEINDKVQKITDAHQRAFGTKPTPGLVFDLLRGDSHLTQAGVDYHSLFGIPKSRREAEAMRIARSTGFDPIATLPVVQPPKQRASLLLQKATLAAQQGKWADFIHDNSTEITELGQNPKYRAQVARIMRLATEQPGYKFDRFEKQAAAFPGSNILIGATSIVPKAAYQIIKTGADFPYGAWKLGSAVGFDLRDLSIRGDFTPERTGRIAKGMGEAISEDVRHPLRNPGYLVMDVWGALSLGAGTAARLTNASREAAATARASNVARGAAAFAETVVKKPKPQGFQLGFATYSETIPLRENAASRFLQRQILERRQRLMMERQSNLFEASVTPAYEKNLFLYDALFNSETYLRSARQRRFEIEYGVAMAPLIEMQRLATADSRFSAIAGQLLRHPSQLKSIKGAKARQKLGIDKAIQVLLTDDPNPVDTWRNYHQRQIDGLVEQKQLIDDGEVDFGAENLKTRQLGEINYKIGSHKAQLEALALAEQIIRNPPKRFRPLLDQAIAVSLEQERLKRVFLGLDDDIAAQHLAEIGAILRGEHVVDLGEGRRGIVANNPKPVFDRLEKRRNRLDRAQKELNAAKQKARLQPGNEIFAAEVERLTTKAAEAERKLGLTERQVERIKGEAKPLERKVTMETTTKPTFKVEDLGVSETGVASSRAIRAYAPDGRIMGRLSIGKRADNEWQVINVNVLPEFQGRGIASQMFRHAENLLGKGVALAHSPDELLSADGKRFAASTTPGELSLGEQIRQLRADTPGSAYFPFERAEFATDRRARSTNVYKQPVSKFGVRPPEQLGNLLRMEGDAIRIGDFRWDTPDLLADQYGKAVRAAWARVQWNDLWDLAEGVDFKASPYHRPIRDIRSVPESLKRTVKALERKEIDPKVADYLSEDRLDELRRWLYPNEADLEKNQHVRWVDERLILNKIGGLDTQFWRNVDSVMGKLLTPVNEPMRLLLIFASPAYALNAVGSAALTVIHQGFLAPANLGRALAANKIYGREVTNILDALAGSTHTASLVTEANRYTRFSQKFMEGWQRFTDLYFRRAAIVYELRRHGILNDEMSAQDLLRSLKSEEPQVKQALADAAHRGRTAMLDFNRMTWPERATLRHILFVYSFLRASTLYSINFYVEHPVMADVLAHSGAERKDQIDRLVGKMPEWFYRHGYMAVAEGTVFDPIQANLPGMLNDLAYPFASIFGDVPYSSISDLLGPGAGAITAFATGKNLQGEDLPKTGHGRVLDTLLFLANQTPVGYARQRIAKNAKQRPLKEPAVSSSALNPIEAAMQRERSGIGQSTFENDDFWSTWGLVVGRTAVPRHVNRVAGEARYWRDLKQNDIDAFYKHQIDAVDQMIDRQEKALGQAAPVEVRDAVTMVAKVSQAIDQWKNDNPQIISPGNRQVGVVVIDSLREQGRLTDKQAAEWKKKVLAASGRNAKIVYTSAIWQHGGQAWKEWVDRVDAVDWFAQPGYSDVVHQLRDANLGDYSKSASAPKEIKWEYGRQVLRFQQQMKQLRTAIDHASGYDRDIAEADLNEFLSRSNTPVTIKGRLFPPITSLTYGKMTPQQQHDHIISVTQRPWSSLSEFDKQLIYGTPDAGALKGWRYLAQAMKDNAAQNNGRAQPGYKKFAGDYLAKTVAGFKDDYQFAQKPLAARMLQFKPIKDSKYAEDWKWLLTTAENYYAEYKKGGWPNQALSTDFAKRVAPWLKSKISERSSGFQAEVDAFMADHPHMIESLVKP